MSKLTVVFLKDTGHVLAALTRADPPAANEPVGALVDTGLPVIVINGTPTDVTVPVAMLDAVTVDDQPEVLFNPQDFQVVQDPQKLLPPKVTTIGVVGSTVDLAISASHGASVKAQNVPPDKTLRAVVVLQRVTPPGPLVIVARTVTVDSATMVENQITFSTTDKWNMYAFVQKLQPKASPALPVGT
jgi:hypothetical protein